MNTVMEPEVVEQEALDVGHMIHWVIPPEPPWIALCGYRCKGEDAQPGDTMCAVCADLFFPSLLGFA